MTANPIDKFQLWLGEARAHKGIAEPTAMCLATVNENSQPSARIVLLKGLDDRGFVFFTNMESQKSTELAQNPKAALCFHWMPLEKQVRVEGSVTQVSDSEADAYFATRPRESRIGAWSSQQSRPLANRQDLLDAVQDNVARFKDKDVPRPPFWSGWRLVPDRIEFWQQSDFRLHDRELYTRAGAQWVISKLYP